MSSENRRKFMIDVNQLRRGIAFLHDGEILKVTEYSHHKPGRGKATIRVHVRNMRSGANLQLTFNSGERVEDIRLDKRTVQYLYDDGQFYVFMDNETFEQPHLAHAIIGKDARWLKENQELELLFYEGEVIDYNLPLNVELEVVEPLFVSQRPIAARLVADPSAKEKVQHPLLGLSKIATQVSVHPQVIPHRLIVLGGDVHSGQLAGS